MTIDRLLHEFDLLEVPFLKISFVHVYIVAL